jgi:hypothetical protein
LIEWRTAILESDVDKNARLVGLVLSTHMNGAGASCFPSLTRLQRESRLARSTVCFALRDLESAKLIERVRGGPDRPTRYRATSPPTGLPLVRSTDSGSPPTGPEDVHEDDQEPSTRAHARARREKARRRAGGARQLTPEEQERLARLDG